MSQLYDSWLRVHESSSLESKQRNLHSWLKVYIVETISQKVM